MRTMRGMEDNEKLIVKLKVKVIFKTSNFYCPFMFRKDIKNFLFRSKIYYNEGKFCSLTLHPYKQQLKKK